MNIVELFCFAHKVLTCPEDLSSNLAFSGEPALVALSRTASVFSQQTLSKARQTLISFGGSGGSGWLQRGLRGPETWVHTAASATSWLPGVLSLSSLLYKLGPPTADLYSGRGRSLTSKFCSDSQLVLCSVLGTGHVEVLVSSGGGTLGSVSFPGTACIPGSSTSSTHPPPHAYWCVPRSRHWVSPS